MAASNIENLRLDYEQANARYMEQCEVCGELSERLAKERAIADAILDQMHEIGTELLAAMEKAKS